MTDEKTQKDNLHSAREARQGEIVLNKPWKRGVFLAGIVGFVLLALMGALFALVP